MKPQNPTIIVSCKKKKRRLIDVKVHFVGAGPGDVELITLKGYKQLSEADVVIYAGSRSVRPAEHYCKEGAEIHDSASMHLMEIHRCHGAGVKAEQRCGSCRQEISHLDPFEQIEDEEARHRGFDCTPGSQLFSRAASIRVEYTVPGFSKASSSLGYSPDACARPGIPGYARQHQSSMAIFLSVQGIEKVVNRGWLSPETPVAVIYKATWPDEKKVFGGDRIAEKVRS